MYCGGKKDPQPGSKQRDIALVGAPKDLLAMEWIGKTVSETNAQFKI
jgi:hypothetical protein